MEKRNVSGLALTVLLLSAFPLAVLADNVRLRWCRGERML